MEVSVISQLLLLYNKDYSSVLKVPHIHLSLCLVLRASNYDVDR